ncbi:hypothetical protein J6590_049770 [Homalodisca vitripennis]|nr:hypothetical protein J6590_049770 [Homalodisca vitripennis]
MLAGLVGDLVLHLPPGLSAIWLVIRFLVRLCRTLSVAGTASSLGGQFCSFRCRSVPEGVLGVLLTSFGLVAFLSVLGRFLSLFHSVFCFGLCAHWGFSCSVPTLFSICGGSPSLVGRTRCPPLPSSGCWSSVYSSLSASFRGLCLRLEE